MKHTGPLWGIWKIEESSEVLLSLLRNREEYLPQLELIRTEQRRREWLACRVLLQELTGGPVCVAYRPNGAPYLSGSSLHISISHTKGYASCRWYRHRIPFRKGVEDTQSLYESGRRGGYRQRARDGALVASLVCKRDAFQDDRAGRSRLPSPSACPSVSLCGRREFHRL